MWADFLTKPLKGTNFAKLRLILMNLKDKEQVKKQADDAERKQN